MDSTQKGSTSLFEVYLRLRPPYTAGTDKFLEVDEPDDDDDRAYVTIKPPVLDNRRRPVERFTFTKVFEEGASQIDVLQGIHMLSLLDGVLGTNGKIGRDALLATLGVTGSGKSHTILGSKLQRGLTQLTLDVLFRSIGDCLVNPTTHIHELAAADISEAQLAPASNYLDLLYGDKQGRNNSRQHNNSIMVSNDPVTPVRNSLRKKQYPWVPMQINEHIHTALPLTPSTSIRPVTGFAKITRSVAKTRHDNPKDTHTSSIYPQSSSRRPLPCASNFPQTPKVDDITINVDRDASYAVLISMYEVYNDRIFDLLNISNTRLPLKDMRRRALLFKSTECSPDRKVVAGLRKIVCGSMEEALLVLETGLTERKIAGTGSNASSSRSHGFFCIEVKKRSKGGYSTWTGSVMTIVDLAGSERARTAKTAGATLAEAGKINESLMYLGQCMQMQSDNSTSGDAAKPALVPFRQCKLTELLFSNSYPSTTTKTPHPAHSRHAPQKAVMIVTADPHGDFNATSQMLRYSALAREVTVPRIPSITSTILSLSGSTAVPTSAGGSVASRLDHDAYGGHAYPALSSSAASHDSIGPSSNFNYDDGIESGAVDVAALAEEVAVLRLELTAEARRRRDVESSWIAAERRAEETDAAVRDECWGAFEAQLVREKARWRAAWEVERERSEAHVDGKIGILARGVAVWEDEEEDEDGDDDRQAGISTQQLRELEQENERLRARLALAEREKAAMRTPSRKLKVLKGRKWNLDEGLQDVENQSP